MSSASMGLGKEVVQGIFGGLIVISIFVAIGSFVAQTLSKGPPADEVTPAAVAPAEAAPAVAAPAEPAPTE